MGYHVLTAKRKVNFLMLEAIGNLRSKPSTASADFSSRLLAFLDECYSLASKFPVQIFPEGTTCDETLFIQIIDDEICRPFVNNGHDLRILIEKNPLWFEDSIAPKAQKKR